MAKSMKLVTVVIVVLTTWSITCNPGFSQRWTAMDGSEVINPFSGLSFTDGGPVFRYYQETGSFTIENAGPNSLVDSPTNAALLGDDVGMISFIMTVSPAAGLGASLSLDVFEDNVLWITFQYFNGKIQMSGATTPSGQFLPIVPDEREFMRLAPNLTAEDFRDTSGNLEIEVGVNFQDATQGATLFSFGDPLANGSFVIVGEDVVTGDFNDDGAFSCADVDALVAEIAEGTNHPDFDLTGDGLVNVDDRDEWLAVAGSENLSSGGPYSNGDINLDGKVDVADFNIWNLHKFSNTPGWCSGDLSADGVVDIVDYNFWNNTKFTESDVQSVPEPQGWLLSVIGLLLVVGGRVHDG